MIDRVGQNNKGGWEQDGKSSPNENSAQSTPTISLPKGGGAIRGVGEKFAANPVTGMGSMTVPIATSPGRSGFGPQMSLAYNSGNGNGLFGFGWGLSLPNISRKTDKGLPRYRDAEESDVFLLSGAEDLVPVFKQDKNSNWILDTNDKPVYYEMDMEGFRIRRYRPRVEGLFARIERWTSLTDGDVHWRSISPDNILTVYGKDENSRIADPDDKTHIFSWLICETRDDKGNAIIYEYKPEDGVGVQLGQANESSRGVLDSALRKANRHIKYIRYGNQEPLLDNQGRRPRFIANEALQNTRWMFEVVFDYGEHDADAPKPGDPGDWFSRNDPFSFHRPGFEVRTYRLCQRVLMFHHFPDEEGVGQDCLVRSTDFAYRDIRGNPTDRQRGHPIASFIASVTQSGYSRVNAGGYSKKSLPPLEFGYSEAIINETVENIDAESTENLPQGVDYLNYQWLDLDGEGLTGVLTEQADGWFYKRNFSANNLVTDPDTKTERTLARFSPVERVAFKPNSALTGGGAQFMDLAGDGQTDLVELDGPLHGFYERTVDEDWEPFQPFLTWPNVDTRDPNLKWIDLTGDGRPDLLISEDQAFVWHESLGEAGFGPAQRLQRLFDEEKGPHLIFADITQSIFLADLSGDGLTDIVRIRNGEVCYWPNIGYGYFGSKVTMDNSPWFEASDIFDQRRIRLADIDGSGMTDILYLGHNGVQIYFNQSGNAWSDERLLASFPKTDPVAAIQVVDLLGNGTACLVWSSPLPGNARQPWRYIDLMGGQKPHLLVKSKNNLGAETHVHYAPSTRFYLQDKLDGKPWITKLPFPVHVVESTETIDHISRNRFVTRYAYHHGYFDGVEREFRGFGMVEQWDTEELASLSLSGSFPTGDNIDATSHMPPVHTKTWFHTGVYLGRERVSNFFAGLLNATDQGEYYREPGLTNEQARQLLLDDTLLPAGLSVEEEREACRALKGAMLRQEVYAEDGTAKAQHPYTVTEQNFTVEVLQPKSGNRHAVFFTHAREAISYHYERNPADPRIQHALTLEVDDYGNVLKQAAIGYGRRTTIRVVNAQGQVQQVPNPGLAEYTASDQATQTTPLLTYTENRVTKAIESSDTHRNPLPCEALTFDLTGYAATGPAGRFQASDLVEPDPAAPERLRHKFVAPEVAYEATATGNQRRRPIEWLRTLYRRDDLGSLLPLGELQPLALPGESFKLAFTPGLLTQVFQRPHASQPSEALLTNPAAVLAGQAGNRGGYLQSQTLKADGRFPASDADDHWWIPSGQSFFSTNPGDSAAAESTQARQHFFLPRRYRDPFGQDAFVDFDANDLLLVETRDALGNRVTVDANDYRVLQPRLVSDPNRNQTEVAFDTLGMVVGIAVMGKPLPALAEGDSLTGFLTDLTQAQLDAFFAAADAHTHAPALLREATTRIVYDIDRFRRTQQANPNDPTKWQPACAATLARETHAKAPLPAQGLKIQLSFSYSDGFDREIQKKIQAEPGPLVEGGPVVNPRWVGSGWTIFNNKGKPVRQYEPFFSATH
ncbi:MAG: SpvB/TcaC N-terminal domain-containing protein, partial [Candidatus Methylumidiphilus sp.]